MNVIRFNWRLIRKILVILLSVFIFLKIIQFVTVTSDSILKYDHKTKQFFIRKDMLNKIQLKYQNISSTTGRSSYFEFQIKSVLIRYTQIPVQYWTLLLENAVNLGMNTIEVEVEWNSHEPMFKKYDFQSKSNDLNLFIRKNMFFASFKVNCLKIKFFF